MYVVRGVTLLDADIDAGLEEAEIRSTLVSLSLDSILYTADVSLLLNYELRFTLDMNVEVKVEHFAQIQTALLEVWTVEKSCEQ